MTRSNSILNSITAFLLPSITLRLLWRMLLVGAASMLFFSYVCLPMRIQGHSMAPTYRDGQFIFCWRPSYWFSEPERFDVVCVEMAGKRVALLKRVVALPGETVAFVDGRLVVDGRTIAEPFVMNRGDWRLPARIVKKKNVYIVGDNRAQDMRAHTFGQTSIARILGKPLSW